MKEIMKEITIEKALYDELLAVSVWYATMPDCFEAGDRFHEYVAEFRRACLPSNIDGVDYETMYFSHFEFSDLELVAAFGFEANTDYVYYVVMPES